MPAVNVPRLWLVAGRGRLVLGQVVLRWWRWCCAGGGGAAAATNTTATTPTNTSYLKYFFRPPSVKKKHFVAIMTLQAAILNKENCRPAILNLCCNKPITFNQESLKMKV